MEILLTVVGAFLGFGGALLAEGIVRRRQRMRSIHNVVDELNSLLTALDGVWPTPDALRGPHRLAAIEALVRALAHRIHLPIWDSLVGTGDILEFRTKDFFDSLIGIYGRVLELRSRVDAVAAGGSRDDSDDRADDLEDVLACGEQIRGFMGQNPSLARLCGEQASMQASTR